MNVCVYMCINVCIDAYMYYVCIYERMCLCVYDCINYVVIIVYVRTYEWMYVCMFIIICLDVGVCMNV